MTHATERGTEQIPERPALPLVGHAFDIPGGADGLLHVMKEARELGPLFKLRVFGNEINIASGLDLVTELSDESRFRKNVHADLVLLRDAAPAGLPALSACSPGPVRPLSAALLSSRLFPSALRQLTIRRAPAVLPGAGAPRCPVTALTAIRR
ncbi:hypothetical protein P1P68_09240 [Streptomyces scabiei]|uniref:hypothetical protein n=1 Tax=Streptomyces scabiei TaxID=1930 RepID=UPI00298FF94F|nr:hypothetical protein [Streptomyces scabiei]MDW8804967.1 hypothetical protein [Streptomyces scabiei]